MAKVAFHFTPEQRADVAIAGILTAYHQIMETNETGIKAGMAPKCLHDYRIAIRSSRSILNMTKGVLPERPYTRFRLALAKLGRATNALRDLDVLLLRFDELSVDLPPATQKRLAQFRRYLQGRQKFERGQFNEVLASEGYHKFKIDYSLFLSKTAAGSNRTARGRRPIREATGEAIWKAYRAVLHRGALTAESPLEELHKLRKLCKRLRYSLEAFQSLFPEDEIRPLLKDLKRLQEALGALVDLDVQRRLLQQWRDAMQRDKKTSSQTLEAIQALENRLATHKPRKSGKSFESRVNRFLNPANKKQFKKLFR